MPVAGPPPRRGPVAPLDPSRAARAPLPWPAPRRPARRARRPSSCRTFPPRRTDLTSRQPTCSLPSLRRTLRRTYMATVIADAPLRPQEAWSAPHRLFRTHPPEHRLRAHLTDAATHVPGDRHRRCAAPSSRGLVGTTSTLPHAPAGAPPPRASRRLWYPAGHGQRSEAAEAGLAAPSRRPVPRRPEVSNRERRSRRRGGQGGR
jgi:hypothetical protein